MREARAGQMARSKAALPFAAATRVDPMLAGGYCRKENRTVDPDLRYD